MISLRICEVRRFLWRCNIETKGKIEEIYDEARMIANKFDPESDIFLEVRSEFKGWMDESNRPPPSGV